MDLALALVEEDLGREVALRTARYLVLFVTRPGGQAQFSAQLASQFAERDPLRELSAFILEHVDEDLSVPRLAARVALSPRQFARVFRREMGQTPASFVEGARVEVARRLLESTGLPVASVADAAGFGSAPTFPPRLCTPPRCAAERLSRTVPIYSVTTTRRLPMDIVILLFDRVTALDAVGPYEVLSRLPGATVRFVAAEAGPQRSDNGFLALSADHARDDVRAADLLLVPGGMGTRALTTDEPTLAWIRSIHATTTWTTSVCTGSVVLAAAGLLDGLPAVTHWSRMHELAEHGAVPTPGRYHFAGDKLVTAAGVSAGYWTWPSRWPARIAGDGLAQALQLGIEYDPAPPFDAGSVDKAPPEVVQMVRAAMAER